MQVLEAMACGTPVITARNSSLPEAGGEAALYVEDATKTEQITDCLAKVLGDESLATAMRAKGLAWVQQFSWERSARKLLGMFEALD